MPIKTRHLILSYNDTEYSSSLEAVRIDINKARNKAYHNQSEKAYQDPEIQEIIVPVLLGDENIYLVLNNRVEIRDGGEVAFPSNLYIIRVLNHNEEVIYDDPEGEEYEAILPTVNLTAFTHTIITNELHGNSNSKIEVMIRKLAMLVEAIRSNIVGEVIADALLWNNHVVDFSVYNEVIRGWKHESEKYIDEVKLALGLADANDVTLIDELENDDLDGDKNDEEIDSDLVLTTITKIDLDTTNNESQPDETLDQLSKKEDDLESADNAYFSHNVEDMTSDMLIDPFAVNTEMVNDAAVLHTEDYIQLLATMGVYLAGAVLAGDISGNHHDK